MRKLFLVILVPFVFMALVWVPVTVAETRDIEWGISEDFKG